MTPCQLEKRRRRGRVAVRADLLIGREQRVGLAPHLRSNLNGLVFRSALDQLASPIVALPPRSLRSLLGVSTGYCLQSRGLDGDDARALRARARGATIGVPAAWFLEKFRIMLC
jgi:hypothetical protein